MVKTRGIHSPMLMMSNVRKEEKTATELFLEQLATGETPGRELAETAIRMVNGPAPCDRIATLIREDRKARAAFRPIACAWIMRLGEMEKEGAYDGCNENAVKTGAALCRTARVKTADDAAAASFAAAMSLKDRTSQQLFSGVVFRFLSEDISLWELVELNIAMAHQGYPEGSWYLASHI